MGIIKTSKLVHEFIRRDEEGNVESITTALDNVNLDIKEGQFIAILGHNGSGKSTLAKHINALLAPSDGTIWVDGMDVSKEENVIPVRKSAGMVFQNPDNQIIANVVEEDVGFGPENIGVPTDEIWQRVDYALRAVGMTKYRGQTPRTGCLLPNTICSHTHDFQRWQAVVETKRCATSQRTKRTVGTIRITDEEKQ